MSTRHPSALLLTLLLLASLAHAAAPSPPSTATAVTSASTANGPEVVPVVVIDKHVAEQRQQLEQLRLALVSFDIAHGSRHDLGSWRKQLGQMRSLAQKEVGEQEIRLSDQRKRLEQLGSPSEQDEPEVLTARQSLSQAIRDMEKRLAAWKSLTIGVDETVELLSTTENEVVRVRLFGRGDNVLEVVNANLVGYQEWWPVTVRLVRTSSGLDILGEADFISLVVASLFGLGLGWLVRRRLLAGYRPPGATDLTLALLRTIPACGARFAPLLGANLAAFAFLALSLPLTPLPLVTQAVIALGLYLLLTLGINVVLEPCPPAQHYLPLEEGMSRTLARRLKALMFLFVVGYLLFASPFGNELPQMQQLLVRAVYFGFVVVNLIWAIWLLGEVNAVGRTFRLRGLLSLLFVVALVGELLGYRNLSLYLLGGLLGSIAGITITLFLARLLGDMFDGLDSGRLAWEQRLRSALHLGAHDPFPGLIWLRLVTSVSLWGALGYWLLKLWGLSDRGVTLLRSLFTDGFDVGTFHIVPMQWIGGILVFALMVSLAGWMRGQVVPTWLSRTRLDRGVRDSMATMSGYIFVLLAAVLGLATAGLDFSNLALIAGALSVGIGFGLQNVVNNFVSGIILLFERPIRVGDWIVVGSTEGYVRRISIRSTLIQTFDRADVIVPNSELISGQVTNWMLRDPWGRVIVPIGVAYGSDPEQVRDILLRVAKAHPECLADGSLVAAPRVVFQGFGDNSLNFELRLFIRNVDAKVTVRSDLNYAIEKELRAAEIGIPFPQRDVHLNLMTGDGKSISLEELRALLRPEAGSGGVQPPTDTGAPRTGDPTQG